MFRVFLLLVVDDVDFSDNGKWLVAHLESSDDSDDQKYKQYKADNAENVADDSAAYDCVYNADDCVADVEHKRLINVPSCYAVVLVSEKESKKPTDPCDVADH